MSDEIIEKIEKKFTVPDHVLDKIRNVVEKEGNSYILYETRPVWNDNAKPWTKHGVAKITHVKTRGYWKLYWMRASGKWEIYSERKSFSSILGQIEEDKHRCFWG